MDVDSDIIRSEISSLLQAEAKRQSDLLHALALVPGTQPLIPRLAAYLQDTHLRALSEKAETLSLEDIAPKSVALFNEWKLKLARYRDEWISKVDLVAAEQRVIVKKNQLKDLLSLDKRRNAGVMEVQVETQNLIAAEAKLLVGSMESNVENNDLLAQLTSAFKSALMKLTGESEHMPSPHKSPTARSPIQEAPILFANDSPEMVSPQERHVARVTIDTNLLFEEKKNLRHILRESISNQNLTLPLATSPKLKKHRMSLNVKGRESLATLKQELSDFNWC